MRALGTLFVSLLLGFGAATVSAQTARKLAADVVRVDSGVLEVRTTAGEMLRITLPDRVPISVRGASDLSQIRQGTFVGVTAAPRADGTLVASEVHLFPEALRGLGEGHRPTASGGGTMTNATVASVTGSTAAHSTMTNATVAKVAGSTGERTLTLTYKGGQKVIVVPVATPITTYEEGNAALLVPGAHVVVSATTQPDGSLRAQRVTVGKDGYVPPL